MKKTFSLLLAFLMVLAVIPMVTINVSAATNLTEEQFSSKLAKLRVEYPDGKYWNQYNGVDTEGIAKAGNVVCSGVSNYNGVKCTKNGYCAYKGEPCTCKCGYYNGWQCFGFANLMAYKVFGSYATTNYNASGVNSNKGWGYYKTVDKYYAGDVVRINNNHSIFITKVSESKVYYVECNNDGPCMIDWDNSITLTSLKSQTTFVVRMNGNTLTGTGTTIPILTINYHANGGTIDSTITGHKYEVTANEGLNMRSGAGTSNSLVKSFAKGTTFTVDVGNTKNANGYTWGKTTIDGKTGWVVISDFVSEIAVLRNTDYYLSSSLVYKTSTSDAINDKILYGVTFPNGLYNASTFKLTREGYRFVGWSASPDGSTTVFDQDAALKAEDVCPELKDGNKSITLYAIWEKDCSENHNYQYSLSTAPTASATGTLTGTCTVCAGTTTITLPKLSATDYTYSVTKAATCTEAGTGCYTWKTTTYGSFVFDITIAALGHDYQNGICTRCLEKDPDYTVVDPNAPSIVIGNTTGTAGDTVTVTVDLKNNPGFGGMAYNVYYDSSVLELISYELGIGAAICVDSGIDGYVGRVNFQYGGITNVTGDGILVTITFKIKENAKEGFTAITVVPEKGSSFRYEGRNEIDFDLVGIDGGITVIDYIKGDINGDGAVNNRDAVRLMQYLAGWDVEITEAAMDANGDGTVNNRDAIRIMQYLAGWEVELF